MRLMIMSKKSFLKILLEKLRKLIGWELPELNIGLWELKIATIIGFFIFRQFYGGLNFGQGHEYRSGSWLVRLWCFMYNGSINILNLKNWLKNMKILSNSPRTLPSPSYKKVLINSATINLKKTVLTKYFFIKFLPIDVFQDKNNFLDISDNKYSVKNLSN